MLPSVLQFKKSMPLLLSALTLLTFNATTAHADSTIILNSNDLQQRIDGFGASDAWMAGGLRWSFTSEQQTIMLDALFSTTNGAGLSLLRQRLPYDLQSETGVWNFWGEEDTLWLAREAIRRGVDKVWTTPWSPPAWMKTTKDVNNGGELARSHYQDYANYLTGYVLHEKAVLGDRFYALSLQNEPDLSTYYESCLWSGAQFHDFLKDYLIPTFQKNKVSTKIILAEHSNWNDILTKETLADPYTAQFLGIVGTHEYGGTIAPFTGAQAQGKPIWETEVSNLDGNDPAFKNALKWAIHIHQSLTIANVSAWHYWWLLAPGFDGQGLIGMDGSTHTYQIYKRLWTLGNFSRFVRPGFQRITLSANNPEPEIYTSAYRDLASGKIVLVVINNSANRSTITVKSPVFRIGRLTPYRTSAAEDLVTLPSFVVAGNTFSVAVPAQSVTTFVGQGSVNNLTGSIQVHAGGSAVGSYLDDVNYSGGTSYKTNNTIVTSGTANAAPATLYQTHRWGRFTYTFPGLIARTKYTVRLHFAELYWSQPGQRQFNVAINRQPLIKNLDVLSEAGRKNRALTKTFTVDTGASNAITLQFSNGAADNAMVSGIEILPAP